MDARAASIAASMLGNTSSPVRNQLQVVLCGDGMAARLGRLDVLCNARRFARSARPPPVEFEITLYIRSDPGKVAPATKTELYENICLSPWCGPAARCPGFWLRRPGKKTRSRFEQHVRNRPDG